MLLLRQADRRLGLSKAIAAAVSDGRSHASCDHDSLDLLRQRLYAIAPGYEDINDHDTLRRDVAVQTAVERDQYLVSAATLCRFENRADCATAWRFHEVLFEQFIASFKRAPRKLILDFDATDDPVHGEQEGRFFHGYYRHYCFRPLYVFCGDQLLVSYLGPSNIDCASRCSSRFGVVLSKGSGRYGWQALPGDVAVLIFPATVLAARASADVLRS